jgi:dihydrolipoamide dehydrogenase
MSERTPDHVLGIVIPLASSFTKHIHPERAVDITQVAAIAISAGMRVDDLARIPLSFPTYAGILSRVAAIAAIQLNLMLSGKLISV